MSVRRARPASLKPRLIHVTRGSVEVSFWYRGRFRGCGLPTIRIYRNTSVGRGLVYFSGGQMPERPSVASLVASGASKGDWERRLPHLAGWLCDATYPDGVPIGPTQLALKREGSVIRATLKLSDEGGLKASAVGESPADAIAALDLVLGSDTPPWERDAYPLAGSKVKKK